MKNKGQTTTVVLSAGVLLLAATVWGQAMPTQTGHELDANPSIGSRYNTPGVSDSQINSQLYVTGQVTGLGYFHGTTGYHAPGQLQTSVPSAGLSRFRAQSVGVTEALGGQSYLPSPYYSRSQTVLGVPSILTGQTMTGTNVPRSQYVSPPSATSLGQQLYIDALADYRTREIQQGGRVLAPELAASLPQLVPGPLRAGGYATGVAGLTAPNIQFVPTTSSAIVGGAQPDAVGNLFGVTSTSQQSDLARELYFQAHPEMINAQRKANRDLLQNLPGRIDANLPGTSSLGQGGVQAGVAPSAVPGGQEPNQPANPTPDQLTLRGLSQSLPGTPARNQDVFMDMLLTLRNAREKRKIEALVAAGLKPPEDTGLLPQPGPKTGTLVETLAGGRMMIHSLAGESKDMFNIQMGRAGKDLRSKQYYEAAYAYETASLQDQNNPLARLGRGLSLLGAGESLTAAYEIERAIQIFPPLGKAQVDLPAIMGSDALKRQLEQLDARIKTASPQARQRLQFLATFLYYNSQQFDKAKSSAEKLITDIQHRGLMRAYAENVLNAMSSPTSETDKQPEPQTPPAVPGAAGGDTTGAGAGTGTGAEAMPK